MAEFEDRDDAILMVNALADAIEAEDEAIEEDEGEKGKKGRKGKKGKKGKNKLGPLRLRHNWLSDKTEAEIRELNSLMVPVNRNSIEALIEDSIASDDEKESEAYAAEDASDSEDSSDEEGGARRLNATTIPDLDLSVEGTGALLDVKD